MFIPFVSVTLFGFAKTQTNEKTNYCKRHKDFIGKSNSPVLWLCILYIYEADSK